MAKTDLIVRLIGDTSSLNAGLKRATTGMMKFKRTIGTVAGSLGLAFGGAIVLRGIGSAIGKIADFETQMNKVAAVSGATASEVKKLKNNALELGSATKFTAIEIGGMQESMARLGKTSREIIGATEAVSDLAIATATELAPAAELMVKTMNAFHIETSESARVANILAEATAGSALNMEGLGVAMSFAASSGRAFGFSLERTTAALGILQDNGLEASKAGTGLRTIFIALSASGMTFEAAMERIATSEDRLKASFDLFGKTAAVQGLILSENKTKLEEFTESLSDANLGMDRMVDILNDDLNTDLALLGSAWDGLIMKGTAVNTIGRDFVQWLTDAVEKAGGNDSLSKNVDSLAEAMKGLNVEMTTLEMASFRSVGGTGKGRTKGLELIRKWNAVLKSQAERQAMNDASDAKISADSVKRRASELEAILKIKEAQEELNRVNKFAGMQAVQRQETEPLAPPLALGDSSQLPGVEGLQERIAEAREGFNAESQAFLDDLTGWDENVQMVIDGVSIALSAGFQAIGAAIASGEDPIKAAGNAILSVFAGLMSQLGQSMIASGVAMLVAQAAFTNPITAGAGLIAAGAALAILGGALGAFASGAQEGAGGGRCW